MSTSGLGKAFRSHWKSQFLRPRTHHVSMWMTSTGSSCRSRSLTSFWISSCVLYVPPLESQVPNVHLGGTGARPVRPAYACRIRAGDSPCIRRPVTDTRSGRGECRELFPKAEEAFAGPEPERLRDFRDGSFSCQVAE